MIRRLASGDTIHSLHDIWGHRIAEYLYDDVSGTSELIREYIWADDTIVAVFENGTLYSVRTDHIGRPVFATDGSSNVVWEAAYLPFGGVRTATGANIDLRFPGQWFQTEAALHQNWMRDYDPTTGRYFQADPLGLIDGPNIYGYARQSPLMITDPNGECPWCFALAFGAAAAVWNAWDRLDENNWQWECINLWRVGGAGLTGAALGPASVRSWIWHRARG
ncbi:MAG: RHS repeat-associated core domain-containing protein [Rhizobiaceae bacterium]|nr:RHS repeat-associated core domain-containing protein [Alphaproteobacteria bacterium]MCB1468741.1 RHS repeat-associated core domain-containing protein [Rhizobiaceae bacterium]